MAIAAVMFSCSEDDEPITPANQNGSLIGMMDEWTPESYTIGANTTEHLIFCGANDLDDVSNDLDEFLYGDISLSSNDLNCASCLGFSGTFNWASRCDESYKFLGNWQTNDKGATMGFNPGSSMDFETITFKSTLKENTLKLRYESGSQYIIVNYIRK